MSPARRSRTRTTTPGSDTHVRSRGGTRIGGVTAGARGALAGPLLLLVLVSPAVTALSAESLVAHHVAHWLMVAAGALAGYQLRGRWQPPARAGVAWAAWLGLGSALFWHLPPALALTRAGFAVHALVHASLLAGGAALGWALPGLGGSGRAALFIAASVVMWPVALADLGGAFSYPGYRGQAAAAGVSELAAMPLAWLVLALWRPLRAALSRPAVALTLQGAMAGLALLGWTAV